MDKATAIITLAERRLFNLTGVYQKLVPQVIGEHPAEARIKELSTIWGVETEYFTNRNRSSDRVVMRAICADYLYKSKVIDQAGIIRLIGYKNHSSIPGVLRNVERWRYIKDPVFKTYYEPVKHLFEHD